MTFYQFLRPIVTVVCKLLWRAQLKNEEIVPKEGPFILVSNHISYAEPIIYLAMMKRHVYFMAKEELFQGKIKNKFFTAMGAFPIKRGAGDQSGMNAAFDILERGEPLGIFAEGTRTKTGKLLPFKSGTAVIAAKAKVPVVTAAVKTKEQKVKLFRKITIEFGSVMTTEQLGLDTESMLALRGATRMMRDDVARLLEEQG